MKVNLTILIRKFIQLLTFLYVLFLFLHVQEVNGQSYFKQNLPSSIRIGGLFDNGGDPLEEVAFKHAVQRVNEKTSVSLNTYLSAKLERILPGNSYFANETTCRMLEEGVAMIIGPTNDETACHVQSICDAFELLHIQTKWDFRICKNQFMVNLFPNPDLISTAITDLVREWEWEKFVILYDDGLFRLENLLKAIMPPKKVIIRKLPAGDDFRPILEQILHYVEYNSIIIDCNAYKTEIVMKQAQQIGLMNRRYNYILTSLDIHTMNLDDYMYGKIPIVAFSMVDPHRPDVQRVIAEFNSLAGLDLEHRFQLHEHPTLFQSPQQGEGGAGDFLQRNLEMTKDVVKRLISSLKSIPLHIALMYDAVQMFGDILPRLSQTDKINTSPLRCSDTNWKSGHGSTIMNYMKTSKFDGLTGPISFANNGYRGDITLDIVQLQRQGLKKIGTWSSSLSSRFAWDKSAMEVQEIIRIQNDDLPLEERHFRIVTIINEPFCMMKSNTSVLHGNDRFEGYNIDLIKKVSELLKFTYEFKLVYDETSYGGYNETTKQWDGMMREILENTSDIAVGDLAISEIRQTAVEFTMPHMNLGISLLYVAPMAKPPGLLSFMNPFAIEVWMCTLLAFFGVSLTLFIVARISPKEWDCPMPCIQNPTKLHNQFSLANSIWFTIGAIMQQGSDLAPKSTSTRIVAAMWWFFTLIMVSSYTAGLALFLIVQDKDDSIKGIQDLVKQNKVRYGCVKGGSTFQFFKGAPPDSVYALAYERMEQMNPSPFMEKNIQGVNMVKQSAGDYAFLMESTLIEYNVAKECGLAQLGGLLDSKGYGIVLPKNSTYLGAFNGAILHLQEKGELTDLKRKWWKEKVNPPVCVGTGVSGVSVQALGLANLSGVFVVLVVGCILGMFITAGEFIWTWKKRDIGPEATRKQIMMDELKFAMKFGANVKQVRRKSSSITSTNIGPELEESFLKPSS